MNLLSKEKLLDMRIPAGFVRDEDVGEGLTTVRHSIYNLSEEVRATMKDEGITAEQLAYSICEELHCMPVPGYGLYGFEYDDTTGVLKFYQRMSCD